MSWASHNPELYDEMCRKGIVNKIMKNSTVHDHFTEEDALEFVEQLEDSGYGTVKHRVFVMLRDLASKEITDVECDYFSARADRARDAAKDREMGL